jgi:hypothetical protein
MSGDAHELVKSAAVQTLDGTIFEDRDPEAAKAKALAARKAGPYTLGFITHKGRFIDAHEAISLGKAAERRTRHRRK